MRFFLFILSVNSASVLCPPVPSCPHQPDSRQPSRWARLVHVQGDHQVLALDSLNVASLRGEIRSKLFDLAGLIHDKKNEFTRDELRRSYNYYDLALKTMSYDFLVSATASTSSDDLSRAYEVFQRLALALEVVRMDMDHHEDMTLRTRNLWHRVEAKVDSLLKLLHVGLGGEGGLVGRQVLPTDFTCVQESVSRDFRDFLVLRHILESVEFYRP